MTCAVSARLRVRNVLLGVFGVALVVAFCWLLFRYWNYAREGSLIAAIEAQGSGRREDGQGIFIRVLPKDPESVSEKAAVILRGPRQLYMSVFESPAHLDRACRLPLLVSLDLDHTVVQQEDVRAIAKMRELVQLFIVSSRAPRSLWRSLSRLQKLRRLYLEDVALEDDGLAHVVKISSLETLHARDCGVTDKGLGYLRGLRELVELNLSGSRITRLGLRELEQLPKLRRLVLQNCELTDESLDGLSGCTSLRILDVSDNPITDKGTERLARMRNLDSINLNDTAITDEGLRAFEGRSAMSLEVKATAVTEAQADRLRTYWGFLVVTQDE